MTDQPPRLKVTYAIMGACRELTDLFPDSDQVTFNRPDISKGADYWLIVTPLGYTGTRLESHDKIIAWRTRLELAVRFAYYNERTEAFILASEEIRAKLETPNALKNIRLDPPVIVTGEDLGQDIPGQSPKWITQPMLVTVNQFVKS